MRSKSLKRAREDKAWPKIRKTVLDRDGWYCHFPVQQGDPQAHHLWERDEEYICLGAPIDPHHIVPVGRDLTLRLDPRNLITLCRRHHDWVHDHPAEATKLGLLASAPPVLSKGERT